MPSVATIAVPGKRGPKTPEGKARSRMNALRHGLRAEALQLPVGEDAARFAALTARLRRSLAPEDDTELELVDAIALAMWKEIRADRLETELLDSLAPEDDQPYHASDLITGPANRATLGTVVRYQSAAANATRRAMDLFLKYRKARREGLVEQACTNEFLAPEPPPSPPAPESENEAAGQGARRGCAEAPARGEARCTNEFPRLAPAPTPDPGSRSATAARDRPG